MFDCLSVPFRPSQENHNKGSMHVLPTPTTAIRLGGAVRVLHAATTDDPNAASGSSNKGQSMDPLITDRVPLHVMHWDPFECSSIAQTNFFFERLDRDGSAAVIEVGYSVEDEGSTLTRRGALEGNDSVAWYLFGSGERTGGFIELLVDRGCRNGGSSWVSLYAIERLLSNSSDTAIDLIAPFLPSGGGGSTSGGGQAASKKGRHDHWTQAMMFTSGAQFLQFLRTTVLASLSFQRKRRSLSYVCVVSNTRGEEVTIVIANEKHHSLVSQVCTQIRSQETSAGTTVSGDTASLRGLSSGAGALRETMQRFHKRAPPLRSDGGAESALLPFLVVRVPRDQRRDHLDVVGLLNKVCGGDEVCVSAETTSVPQELGEVIANNPTVGAPTPVATPTAGAMVPAATTTTDARTTFLLREQLDACRQSLQDIEDDIQNVLKSTESCIVEHRNVMEDKRLTGEELETSKRALVAIRDRCAQLSAEYNGISRHLTELKVRLAKSGGDPLSDSVVRTEEAAAQRTQLDLEMQGRKRIDALIAEHQKALQQLAIDEERKLSKQREKAHTVTRELELFIRNTEANMDASVRNQRNAEVDVGRLQESVSVAKRDIEALRHTIDRASQHWLELSKVSAAQQALDTECQGLEMELERVNSSIQVEEQQLLVMSKVVARVSSDIDAEQKLARRRDEDSQRLRSRLQGMQKSALFAEESALRTELHVILMEEVTQLMMIARTLERSADQSLDQTVASATAEMMSHLEEASQREVQITAEITDIEERTKAKHQELAIAMESQEAKLAVQQEEVKAVFRRLDELKSAQEKIFAVREGELATLRRTYQNLFHEFLVQVEEETQLAYRHRKPATSQPVTPSATPRAAGTSQSSRRSSRATSPVPSAPKQELTSNTLKAHQELTEEESASWMDTCVRLYMLWGEECTQLKHIQGDIVKVRQRASRTEMSCLHVAETLGLERKRIADLNSALQSAEAADEDVSCALRDFIAASGAQKQQMEDAIATLLHESQEAFKTLVKEVSTVEERIKKLEETLMATQRKTASVAFELETKKEDNTDDLRAELVAAEAESRRLEQYLATVRAQQRMEFTLNASDSLLGEMAMPPASVFGALEERTIRSMGIASMRDPENLLLSRSHHRHGATTSPTSDISSVLAGGEVSHAAHSILRTSATLSHSVSAVGSRDGSPIRSKSDEGATVSFLQDMSTDELVRYASMVFPSAPSTQSQQSI